jgi:hypothetical protein
MALVRSSLCVIAVALGLFAGAVVLERSAAADDATRAEGVARSYAAALATDDGQRACALMTPESQDRFANVRATTCDAWFDEFAATDRIRAAYRRVRVGRAVVNDSTATVKLSGRLSALSLVERGGQWQLDFTRRGEVRWVSRFAGR